MEIQVLGAHNCESNSTRLTSLMVDGTLALDASAITSNLSFEDQTKLEAIFITHYHYDHIKDIPALSMNLYLMEKTVTVYSIEPVVNAIKTYMLNDDLYPRFYERPSLEPVLRFVTVNPYETFRVGNYSVRPIPVNHSIPATGFQIKDSEDKTIFYTGDTGKGLNNTWKHVNPDLLIIELTAPNKWEAAVGNGTKHLTPRLLKQELVEFKRINDYLPRILLVHINPFEQREIASEIADIAKSLNASITPGAEGMVIKI